MRMRLNISESTDFTPLAICLFHLFDEDLPAASVNRNDIDTLGQTGIVDTATVKSVDGDVGSVG